MYGDHLEQSSHLLTGGETVDRGLDVGSAVRIGARERLRARFDAERCLRDTLAALAGDRAPSAAKRHEHLAATAHQAHDVVEHPGGHGEHEHHDPEPPVMIYPLYVLALGAGFPAWLAVSLVTIVAAGVTFGVADRPREDAAAR